MTPEPVTAEVVNALNMLNTGLDVHATEHGLRLSWGQVVVNVAAGDVPLVYTMTHD